MRTIKRDIVGAFILSSDDKILLGKSGVYEGQWVVPGGGLDDGETKTQALSREILEETGIDISNATIEPINRIHAGCSSKILRDSKEEVIVDMTFYDFVVRLNIDSNKVSIISDDDFSDAQWFELNKLSTLNLGEPTKNALNYLNLL